VFSACSGSSSAPQSSEIRDNSSIAETVACELSMNSLAGAELTERNARSCNDLQVNSAREKDLVTGLCKLSSVLNGLSYRTSDRPCDIQAAAAICVAGSESDSTNLLQKTYFYYGQDSSESDRAKSYAGFEESCKNLNGSLEVLQK
jgi:hypothetical protein